ncbi:MAG TPA: hypothetical protein ACFYD6_09125 [Candidatus Brocadiia bacterium]|nr:hypothetical protein [Candidatus Brocadiales bacterium]
MKKTQSKLSMAPVSTKIYFTLFLLLIGCAFVISMLNYYDKTRFSYDRTIRYYRGDEESFSPSLPPKEQVGAGFKPAPTDPDEGMFFQKTYQELLSTTHTHCFSIAIVLFVLSRILSMTMIKECIKISVYSLAFAGMAANLGATWLITFVTPYATIMLSLSNIALCISFGAYVIIPLYEIWLGQKSPLPITDNNNS